MHDEEGGKNAKWVGLGDLQIEVGSTGELFRVGQNLKLARLTNTFGISFCELYK